MIPVLSCTCFCTLGEFTCYRAYGHDGPHDFVSNDEPIPMRPMRPSDLLEDEPRDTEPMTIPEEWFHGVG